MSNPPVNLDPPRGAKLPARCARVQARLLDYLDGDLNAADKQEVRSHLDVCATCRQELALCRQSELALMSARHALPPAGDLRAGFYARLEADRPSRALWPQWRLAIPVLAAGLLGLVLLRTTLLPRHPVTAGPENTQNGSIASSRLAATGGSHLPPSPAGSEATGASRHQGDANLAATSTALLADAGEQPSILNTPDKPARVRLASPIHRARRLRQSAPPILLASNGPVAPSDEPAGLSMPGLHSAAPAASAATASGNSLFDNTRADTATTLHKDATASKPNSEETMALAAKSAYADVNGVQPSDADTGVTLRVVDEVRGFTAGVHIASDVEERNGDRILIINADDTETASGSAPSASQN